MYQHLSNKHIRLSTQLLLILFCLLFIQCIQSSNATENALGFTIQGTASWYGPKFAGKPTANGEIYNPRELTAAHKSMAFNTIVHVTNLRNGQSVHVRINDRGPYIGDRIIDLSEAAAESIDMKQAGLATVRVEIVKVGDIPAPIHPVDSQTYANYVDGISDGKDDYKEPASDFFDQPSTFALQPTSLSSRPYEPYQPNEPASITDVDYSAQDPVYPNAKYSVAHEVSHAFIVSEATSIYEAKPSTPISPNSSVSSVSEGVVATDALDRNLDPDYLHIDIMPGLTKQEVIAPHYPIGTQFLLASVADKQIGKQTGKQLWVQVISNQLPPQFTNTLLISKALSLELGTTLQLLEER